MKSIMFFLTISITIIIFSCKKKHNDPTPSTTSTTAASTTSSNNPVVNNFSTTSNIGNGTLVKSITSNGLPDSNTFNFYSSHIVVAGAQYPDNGLVKETDPTGANCSMAYKVQFQTNAPTFEIYTKANGGYFNILVDDAKLSANAIKITEQAGTLGYIKVDFPDSQNRTIIIECYLFPFGGIKIPSGYTVTKNPFSSKRFICIGDSFTEGVFVPYYENWAFTMGNLLGIQDLWSSGSGTTGYLETTTGRFTFRGRIQQDVLRFNPDYIFIYGSLNDAGKFPPAAIQAEAESLYAQIRSTLPNVKLIVSANESKANPDTTFTNVNNAIKQACINQKVDLFIDQVNGNWLKGDGTTGQVMINGTAAGPLLNSSNQGTYIGSDGTHPSPVGNDATGTYFYNAITQSGVLQ